MNIRKANKEDVKTLNNLLTKLIQDEKQYDKNINENCVVTSYYENVINDNKNCILIAENDDKIIGYLYGFIIDNGNACIDKVCQLDALYVEENYRNMKIADNLIAEFKKWAISEEIKYIELKVCNENTNAINLYNKHNFESVKTIMNLEL